MEERKSIAAGAIAYLLLLALCIALIRPFVNAGISDDFSYIKSAKDFADTGRMVYNGWAAAMLGWLVPFGALFIKLFGFSFTSTRIATFSIVAINGLLLQWISLRVGCTRMQALFAATAVLLSPVGLPEAMLFFTDGAGLLAMLVTLALCIQILRAVTPRATQLWIVTAFLGSFALGTVRQLLWICTLIMVPSAIWLVRRRKGALPCAAASFVLAVAGIIGMLHWWNHQPYFIAEPLILHYPLSSWTQYLILPLIELLVLLVPVLSLFLLRPVPKKFYIVSGVLALLAPLAIMSNPHDLLSLSSHSIFGDAPQWVLILALAFALGLMPIALRLAFEAATHKRHIESIEQIGLHELAVLLLPFSLVTSVLILTRDSFWLRYWLEVVAAATIWLVKLWSDLNKEKQRSALVAPIMVAVYCAFSVILMHDTFRKTDAVVSSVQWYTSQGMPRDELEAGFALDGWYQIERTGYVNDERITIPAGAYVNHDLPRDIVPCHDFFLPETPSIHPVYGVGEALSSCFEEPALHSVEYNAWMAPHRRIVFIARYTPKFALPNR